MGNQLLLILFCLILCSCFSPGSYNSEKSNYNDNESSSIEFADSGSYSNGIKEGHWVEYTFDTVQAQPLLIIVDNKQSEGELKQTIIPKKEQGNYENGLRDGKWTKFSVLGNSTPSNWYISSETNFKFGKKNGFEITYYLGGDTSTISTFFEGQEHGIGKLFYPEHSNKVWKIYNATNDGNHLLKEFYPSSQLKADIKEVNNTSNQKIFEIITYFENGNVETKGQILENEEKVGKWIFFYENGKPEYIAAYKNGVLDGITKYYHDNGQLWTERLYIKGKLWEVISNYDRQGNKKDKGYIKNGTGELKLFDSEGNFKEVVKYVNGVEQE
jgi:antitoxin component YwqK of YwqJK toxin-antitoxin module